LQPLPNYFGLLLLLVLIIINIAVIIIKCTEQNKDAIGVAVNLNSHKYSEYCREEEGRLLTVVMTPGTLDECVLAIKEAETLFREFLASV